MKKLKSTLTKHPPIPIHGYGITGQAASGGVFIWPLRRLKGQEYYRNWLKQLKKSGLI